MTRRIRIDDEALDELVEAARWYEERERGRGVLLHRIDNEEFYRMLDHGIVIDDANVFNDKLQEWQDFYNFHRPHGGLDGQTPLRTTTKEDHRDLSVTGLRQSHTPNAERSRRRL